LLGAARFGARARDDPCSRYARSGRLGGRIQTDLRTAAGGDPAMMAVLIDWIYVGAECVLGLAMFAGCWRLMHGPRAQDRVLALDSVYLSAMLLLVTFGIRSGTDLYFEVAL